MTRNSRWDTELDIQTVVLDKSNPAFVVDRRTGWGWTRDSADPLTWHSGSFTITLSFTGWLIKHKGRVIHIGITLGDTAFVLAAKLWEGMQ